MEDVPLVAAKGPATLALVVPTLHEAANIERILERIRSSLDPLDIPYEIIIVDDDSRDGTAEVVRKISGADPRVRLLVRTDARGLGGAVVHGWAHSSAAVVGVIDADFQHPPELLPQLWKAMDVGGRSRSSQPLRGARQSAPLESAALCACRGWQFG